MKIGNEVRYKKFPSDKEHYIIVGDKNTPWDKASPILPHKTIRVKEGKDYIIVKKSGWKFGEPETHKNGIHVNEDEIMLK